MAAVGEQVLSDSPAGEHDAAFAAFKEDLHSRGLLERPADIPHSDALFGINDDQTLWRFFAARKYVHKDAIAHFESAHAFRTANRLGNLYNNIDLAVFNETRKMYPQWSGRVCKKGQPVLVLDIDELNSAAFENLRKTCEQRMGVVSDDDDGQDSSSNDSVAQTASVETLSSMLPCEYLTRFVLPLCSTIQPREKPVSKVVILVDIAGLGLRKVWNIKGYIQNFNQVLSLNFPEILGQVLVVNAPYSFPTIWSLVSGWVDPVTASKIHVLTKKQAQSTLHDYIEDEDLPKDFGGSLDFQSGMFPKLDARIMECMDWVPGKEGEFLQGPAKWTREDDNGMLTMVAVGSEGGERRQVCVAKLKDKSINS